ncbi:uncharacterized protein LOC129752761 [Uranotaenia lowii]|uniref:uncharacterized protein LOC129752761 n=1 Tax=Uranotaenia lowii TaxID=190385 RepID=UPI00247A2689|nr:uncharacterized protein LOC129752761 [Uranotaenia lowii]
MSQIDLLEEVPHLHIIAERDVLNAWKTYRVSEKTRQLGCEAGREIFAEAITFRGAEDVSECGPMPKGLDCAQQIVFGYELDVELPLLKLLLIENDTFWKRVAKAKVKSPVEYMQMERQADICWKDIGVALKVAEAIETEPVEYWFEGDLEDTVQQSAPFVKQLKITQLQALRQIEPFEGYEEYKVYNVPHEMCSHGSLEILKHLDNLTSLSIIFGVDDVAKAYERRFFQLSQEDIVNLVKALKKLPNLTHFKISRSRLDSEKLKPLLLQLSNISLECLELPYCYLGEQCGILLGRYISKCPAALKSINLSGNFIDGMEMENFCYGINVFQGVLEKLDISHNPIGEAGVLVLGGGVKNLPHIQELDVTGCEMDEQGAYRVSQIKCKV